MSGIVPLSTRTEPLRPEDVEGALEDLWRTVARDDAGMARTRVRTLNLLVFVPDASGRGKVESILAQLPARHPARVIVLELDAGRDEGLEACVSGHCTEEAGDHRQVCAEEVYIVAAREAVDRLPAVALSLLVPDLPVYVWWTSQASPEDALFRSLARIADRVVLDSQTFAEPPASLAAFAGALRESALPPGTSDLAWGRSAVWREVVAQFFDSRDTVTSLPRLDRVTVQHTGRPGEPAPLLLLGWLASRLGWRPIAHQGTGWTLGVPGRTVAATIEQVQREAVAPGSIVSVELEASAADARVCFQAELSPDDASRMATCVDAAGRRLQARTATFQPPDDLRLLSDELDVIAPDAVYQQALAAAAALLSSPNP